MPDPTTDPATGGQEPPAPDPAPPADPPPPDPVEEFDQDRAMALIRKLRDEVKDAKTEAAAGAQAAARLAEIEREQMTELERTKAEKADADQALAALREQRREDALRLAVYGQRDTLGIASPDLAIAALDRTRVEFDDVGQPTNVPELLEALIEREPVLKGTAPKPPPIPSTDGGRTTTVTPDLTADELEAARTTGMTPERYAAIKKAMGGRKTVSVAEMTAALTPKG